MTKTLETKACRACAIAKRKCGKQTPQCLRCATRGHRCTYPPTKPGSFVLCPEEDTASVESELIPEKNLAYLDLRAQNLRTGGVVDALRPGLDFPGLYNILIDQQFASGWFASSENWQVGFSTTDQSSISVPELKRFINKMFLWLAEWVEKGSNSFIHARLYRTRFPRCAQDAYAALSCYLHRTKSNEQVVFRIIEDRANNLIEENGISPAVSSDNTANSTLLDPLGHVARVHALLIYQIIGLYDGDIRLRHLAEAHMPVLNSWMQEMVLNASQSTSLGGYLISSTHERSINVLNSSYNSQGENLLWYSWILAESIRRAWVVSSGIQVVFMALQQKRADSCQGGMMITTREGIWEAQSSVAWEKLCSEVHSGLMQMVEVERLFTDFAPSEVNEFTKVALEVVYGRDKMERWGVQIEE